MSSAPDPSFNPRWRYADPLTTTYTFANDKTIRIVSRVLEHVDTSNGCVQVDFQRAVDRKIEFTGFAQADIDECLSIIETQDMQRWDAFVEKHNKPCHCGCYACYCGSHTVCQYACNKESKNG